MGNPTGFKEHSRQTPSRRPVKERIWDFKEVYQPWPEDSIRKQGARCMGCAVPFCHVGCPLGNLIPDWNDLVSRGKWREALESLHATNNFPEFTGRICPAPCEPSCVLSINSDPVTIEYIEKAIADRGFEEGWIQPKIPKRRTGKRIGVVGSGPAGLAAAQQLNGAGHWVTVFEQDRYLGGLLTLGIPDFKLEKQIVQRRVHMMAQEGVEFRTGINVGKDYTVTELFANFDAVCLGVGATQARDLEVPGRQLRGVHLAMDYLTQQNRRIAGEQIPSEQIITAEGKRVVILGGGDTGADCLGTAHRQGAREVLQFEILPEPPANRGLQNPWPQWPVILRTSPAHEEGGVRDYGLATKGFSGVGGDLKRLHTMKVEWRRVEAEGRMEMVDIPGTEGEVEADLVLLALGFTHPDRRGLLTELGVSLDLRGNIIVDHSRMTTLPGVFAAGDAVRGASLVVWAIAEGREMARCIDEYLVGASGLSGVRLDLHP